MMKSLSPFGRQSSSLVIEQIRQRNPLGNLLKFTLLSRDQPILRHFAQQPALSGVERVENTAGRDAAWWAALPVKGETRATLKKV